MKNSKRKLKIKKGKMLALIVIIISIVSVINKSYSKVEVNYEFEYASYGDTLWSIAERESKNNKY